MPWISMIGLCLACVPGMVLAQVPRIQGQGAAASAMSNAFAAQADDPSALHYNPAGMTQLRGIQLMAGALLAGGSTDFTGPTGVTATGDRNGTVAWPPPAHTFITANLKDLGLTALGRPFCRNWSDCAVRLADSLAERWAVQDGHDLQRAAASRYQAYPCL